METTTEVKSKRDKGFTLVELLIVIVILGVLATVTVFAVRGITDQGKTSACQADKKTLEVAAEAYFAQYGTTLIAHTGIVDPLLGAAVVAKPATTATWLAGATPGETLKNAGLLRDVSAKYNVVDTGALLPIAPCT